MGSNQISRNEQLTDLVNKYADMVLRLALAHLGNLADAQDVCQEVYIKLFKHQRPFNDDEHEKAWIIRVTINMCKDVFRSPWKKWFSPLEDIPLPNNDTSNMEVVSAVLTLPRKYRIIIHLYYYEGYKTAEIAELLNIKENTIRTQLKRAKDNAITGAAPRTVFRSFRSRVTMIAVSCMVILLFAIGVPLVLQNENRDGQSPLFNGFVVTAYAADGVPLVVKPDVDFPLGQYSMVMSSVPGFPIQIASKDADKIEVRTSEGQLLFWSSTNTTVIPQGKKATFMSGETIYWTPLIEGDPSQVVGESVLKVTAYKDMKKLGSSNIHIKSEDHNMYKGKLINE